MSWAMVVQGMQRDVFDQDCALYSPPLAAAVEHDAVTDHIGELAETVRAAGGTVVHALFVIEPSALGMPSDVPVFARFVESGALRRGSAGVEPVEGLWADGDVRVEKMRVNPFHGSTLDPLLRAAGVRDLVVCGTQTNMGIEAAARHAADCGYRVHVPADACAAASAPAHTGPLTHTLPNLGRVCRTADIVAAVGVDTL
ncbi:isochorismatase family cysteine hydrolase [Pseudonocardia nematodicida]|uniref:Isochorismatase family cysteine hydrolase n=1 Tax=Pseudonocardia nematodicida TaxID=1206997 RepID=A0ABV1KE47_9PSEU